MSQIDSSIPRIEIDGFACPLGVYPTEPSTFEPLQGYFTEFEQADTGDDPEEGWEEWPDRYLFDIVVTHKRLIALLRSLFALLPGRVFPILDVLGHDAYREVDPYIAYDAVGLERFSDAYRRHRGWFLEDGLVGFGAMSVEPFMYVYVDEHKIVTVRAETAMRERVERVLSAYDLPALDEPRGVDSVEHEHREALIETAPPATPADASKPPPAEPADDQPMHRDEIIDELRDVWGLTLNIDPDRNLDDDGNDLGNTGWRCVARVWEGEDGPPTLVEAVLVAGSLGEAERLALEAAEEAMEHSKQPGPALKKPRDDDAEPESPKDEDIDFDAQEVESEVVIADRITPDELRELLGETTPDSGLLENSGVREARIVEP